MTTGFGALTSSGYISVTSANGGRLGSGGGVSGSVALETGTSSKGNSGRLAIMTGPAKKGHGGDQRVLVGTGDSGDGGRVVLVAGETIAAAKAGGYVSIVGGAGVDRREGKGGDVKIAGGKSGGLRTLREEGGSMWFVGGDSRAGTGGNVDLTTGYGVETSSGRITLTTPNSGSFGISGAVNIATGHATKGSSGRLLISSGVATEGKAGAISLLVGTGTVGGDLHLRGGNTRSGTGAGKKAKDAVGSTGGKVSLYSGTGYQASSGAVQLNTPNAGASGVSGHMAIRTGTASAGTSGTILLETGLSRDGRGGDIQALVGRAWGFRDFDGADGGNIAITAGETKGSEVGGNVDFRGGIGASDDLKSAKRWAEIFHGHF